MILEAIPDSPQRALDVGCGEGVLARQLRAVVPQVTAIDAYAASIDLARQQDRGPHIDYLLGDFLTFPFEPHQRGTANGKRVQALGGAKNHAIVLPDADLDFAAEHLTAAGFGSAGERCMAISAAVAVGDAPTSWSRPSPRRPVRRGSDPDARPRARLGPVIIAAARDRIIDLISSGEKQGATLAVDGP